MRKTTVTIRELRKMTEEISRLRYKVSVFSFVSEANSLVRLPEAFREDSE